MRCPYCARENQPGAKSCAYCGRVFAVRRPHPAAQTVPASEVRRPVKRPVPKKRPPKFILILRYLFSADDPKKAKQTKRPRRSPKLLMLCAGVLAVVILAGVGIGAAVHSRGDGLESRHIQMFYSKHRDNTSVVFAGNVYKNTMNGAVKTVYSSADCNVQAALTESGELYYMTTDSIKMVSAGVQSFVLSADGSALAYIMDNTPLSTDVSETEEPTTESRRTAQETTEPESTEYFPAGGEQFMEYAETSLFLYDSLTGKSALIANHVSADSVCLSPSGTTVCYAVTGEEGDSFEGFVFREDVYVSTGHNTLPIAVSDDGLRLYHIKFEYVDDCWIMKLFSKNGENEIKLGEFADLNRFVAYLNKDCSELIFGISGRNGNFFYCDGEAEKIKISSGYNPLYIFGAHEVQNGKVILAPVEKFAKTVFTDSAKELYYLDGKMNCTDTGVSGTMFRLSPDGKTVYFTDENGMLCSCDVRKASRKELASHVMNFDLSADGKTVYYLTSDNELYCRSGSKNTLAAENVYAKGSGLCVTEGGYLYFLKDYAYGNGTLCYIKGSGKAKILEDIRNVHDLAADRGNAIYYRANFSSLSGAYDLYYGEGKKYTCILKELN